MGPEAALGTGGADCFITRIEKAAPARSEEGFVGRANVVAWLDAISYAGGELRQRHRRRSRGSVAAEEGVKVTR